MNFQTCRRVDADTIAVSFGFERVCVDGALLERTRSAQVVPPGRRVLPVYPTDGFPPPARAG